MYLKNKSDNDEEYNNESIKVINNNIYFYGDVDDENILEFNTKLYKLDKKLYKKHIELTGYDPEIIIHIKSDGGDIFAGLSAMDHISSCKCKVICVADGVCASSATFLLMGGDCRLIRPSAYVLIHQISSELWGKFEDMKDELKSCKKFMKIITNIYKKNTTIPEKKLKKMMKRDIYLTSKECLKFGIVSGYYQPSTACKV